MKTSPLTPLKKILVSAAAASLFMATVAGADCTYQLFSIDATKGTKISEFIDQLSDECAFSVIITDPEAEKAYDKALNKTKLKNLTIDEVLHLILNENNLNYSLENNVLKISYIQTKTFNIDYIISQRKSFGSTDVTLSSQSGVSGGGDTDTSQLSGGQSETGIKIESTDEVAFWNELDVELQQVLNRPEDVYEADAPIINKNSGMITVSATVKQMNRLEKYLEELQKKVQYQVLIDVNILSVTMSDGRSTGIDWSQLYALQNLNLSQDLILKKNVLEIEDSLITTMGNQVVNNANAFELQAGATIDQVIKFLKTQGEVSSVSNPKVLTLNNQSALITVGTEYFYSIKSTTQQQTTGNPLITEEVEINSVFAGVLLDITPEISDDGTITLKINPSLTKTREDITADPERSIPPDLDRRQLASVVTVKDGERIILGGLINTTSDTNTNKVPLLGDIPVVGYLFKRDEVTKEVQELVMVIQPHIIKKAGNDISLSDLGYTATSNSMVFGAADKEANE